MRGSKPGTYGRQRIMARCAFTLSSALFLIYFGNIIAGKLSVLGRLPSGWEMGDTTEFLFLFAAAVCFAAGTLLLEPRNGQITKSHSNRVGGNP